MLAFFIVHELIFRPSEGFIWNPLFLNALGALRVIPGGNQVDGLPPASSFGCTDPQINKIEK